MTFILHTFLEGLSLCFSLIIAIGIQNSFVLKQGIVKNHNLLIAMICSFGDAILIIVGVYGIGKILSANEFLLHFFYWGGVAFLFGYAVVAFRSSFKNNRLNIDDQPKMVSLKRLVTKALVVTFLNPNAYLDTCVLMGSVSATLPSDEKFSFTIGAILASFIWFSLLSFGSRFLKPIFEKPIAWKILDFVIGCMMVTIAISLIKHDYI